MNRRELFKKAFGLLAGFTALRVAGKARDESLEDFKSLAGKQVVAKARPAIGAESEGFRKIGELGNYGVYEPVYTEFNPHEFSNLSTYPGLGLQALAGAEIPQEGIDAANEYLRQAFKPI